MPELYKRKAIKLGKTSYAISLPKGWVRYIEAKSGRKLEAVILETDGEIIVKPAVEL